MFPLFLHVVFLLSRPATTAQLHSNYKNVLRGRKEVSSSCNLFQGEWVPGSSNLLYDSSSCPFLQPDFDCVKYGRPDSQFLNYSWSPASCELPRFNGGEFVKRWRGKKIMFVGDSLSLNTWESLGCMIHASVPNPNYSLSRGDPLSSLYFKDRDLTVLFYRTPYLVDIISDRAIGRVLNLSSIQAGNSWRGMDVLIFNSWHWWIHRGASQPWDFIQLGNTVAKDMDRLIAYDKGLSTWAEWVDLNVDHSKTKVFFQGISPTHYQGKDWDEPKKSCKGETQPVSGSTYPAGSPPEAGIVKRVMSSMKKPVYLLDITLLSQLRKDAHPSLYSGGSSGGPGINDCSHWCLPGLPDTWNQLLYAALTTL